MSGEAESRNCERLRRPESTDDIRAVAIGAATVYRRGLLGVILTGANEDGAEGLAAVHDAGGITVVQQPQTAQAPTMVLAAMHLRSPDLALPLSGIAELFRKVGLDSMLRTD